MSVITFELARGRRATGVGLVQPRVGLLSGRKKEVVRRLSLPSRCCQMRLLSFGRHVEWPISPLRPLKSLHDAPLVIRDRRIEQLLSIFPPKTTPSGIEWGFNAHPSN